MININTISTNVINFCYYCCIRHDYCHHHHHDSGGPQLWVTRSPSPGCSSKKALSLLELSNSSLNSLARASFTTALVMERAMSSPLYLKASTAALVRPEKGCMPAAASSAVAVSLVGGFAPSVGPATTAHKGYFSCYAVARWDSDLCKRLADFLLMSVVSADSMGTSCYYARAQP